jgi:phage/plasmid-associated DNA primase
MVVEVYAPVAIRGFAFEVNRYVRNKQVLVDSEFPHVILNSSYTRIEGTIHDVAREIQQGHAICGSLLKEGGRAKKTDYFDGINWLVIDIDNKTPGRKKGEKTEIYDRNHSRHVSIAGVLQNPFVRSYASLIYTTPSHDPQETGRDCFRIIFCLSRLIEDQKLASKLIVNLQNFLINEGFDLDVVCKDPSRLFYGNDQAIIPLIQDVGLPEFFIDAAIKQLEEEAKIDYEARSRKPIFHERSTDGIAFEHLPEIELVQYIEQALNWVNADSYDTWFRIGAALKSAEQKLGSLAFQLWDDWSKSCPSKYDAAATRRKWDQLNSSGITLGTLFFFATNAGMEKTGLKQFLRNQRFQSNQIARPQRNRAHFQSLITKIPEVISFLQDDTLGVTYEKLTDANDDFFIFPSSTRSAFGVYYPHPTGDTSLKRVKLVKADPSSRWKSVDSTTSLVPYYLSEALAAIESARNNGSNVNSILVVEEPEVAALLIKYCHTPVISLSEPGRVDWIRLAVMLKEKNLFPVFIPGDFKSRDTVRLDERLEKIRSEFHGQEWPFLYLPFKSSNFKAMKDDELSEETESVELPFGDDPVADAWGHIGGAAATASQEYIQSLESSLTASISSARAGHPELPKKTVAYAADIKELCESYLRWDSATRQWMGYDWKKPNQWAPVSSETVMREVISSHLENLGIELSLNSMEQIASILKYKLEDRNWNTFGVYIPFANGVYDKDANTFLSHSPRHKLVWQMPHEFTPSDKTREELIQDCRIIWDWLVESVQNVEVAVLMLAYLAAIIRNYTELQKFMMCVGRPGSGKGTFLRLAAALVGKGNSCSTTLSDLSSNRFTMAKLIKVPLILIGEAQNWIHDVTVLKALTGQDVNSVEVKGVQQTPEDDQAASGLILMAGERIPATKDTGGLQRRQIVVNFKHNPNIGPVRDLITIGPNGGITGEFAPCIPAFFNLILSFTKEEIFYLIKNASKILPEVGQAGKDAILSGSSLMQWIEACIYHVEDGDQFEVPETQVGNLRKNQGEFVNPRSWLYANYRAYCDRSAITAPLGLAHFANEVDHVFNSQLGLKVEFLDRPKRVKGIGLRAFDEDWEQELETTSYPRVVTEIYTNTLEERDGVESSCNPFPDFAILYPNGLPY